MEIEVLMVVSFFAAVAIDAWISLIIYERCRYKIQDLPPIPKRGDPDYKEMSNAFVEWNKEFVVTTNGLAEVKNNKQGE